MLLIIVPAFDRLQSANSANHWLPIPRKSSGTAAENELVRADGFHVQRGVSLHNARSHISELLSRTPIAGASTRDSLFVLIRVGL